MINSFSFVGMTPKGYLMELTWNEQKQQDAFIGLKFNILSDCCHCYFRSCYVHVTVK